MSKEEKQAIKTAKCIRAGIPVGTCNDDYIILLNLIEKQQKEIEELKKVIKMVEIYKSHGIPEDVEMVIMRRDNFLRNNNNEFISKDTIKEIIEEHYPDVAITKLQELLEE